MIGIRQKEDLKEFIRYAALNGLGMAGLSCYILADTYFVADGLGPDGLAALNIAIPVYSFVHGSGLMLGMGGATKFSVFLGQRSYRHAGRIFTNTLYLAVLMSAVFLLAGGFFSGTIAAALGADGAIWGMASQYLRVILLFSPAFLMNDILICFVRNDGDPRRSMIAMLAGSFSNIGLDYLLIFPLRMGIFGAALATGVAPLISMCILSMHWIKKKSHAKPMRVRPSFRLTADTCSLGFPSLVTEVAAGIVMIVFNILILGIRGNIGVAAYGIIANLSLVITSIFTGIAQGMQPIVSRAYGCGDGQRIRRTLSYALKTVLASSCVIYLSVILFADPITAAFNRGQNVQLHQIAVGGLKRYFMAVPFVGVNVVACAFFTSTEKALPAQVVSLLRGMVLMVPAAFFLSHVLGMAGVWLSYPLTEGVVCAVGITLLLRGNRQAGVEPSGKDEADEMRR